MVPALMVPARNRRSVERLFIMSDASPHLRRGQRLPVSGDAERSLPNARRDVSGRPKG